MSTDCETKRERERFTEFGHLYSLHCTQRSREIKHKTFKKQLNRKKKKIRKKTNNKITIPQTIVARTGIGGKPKRGNRRRKQSNSQCPLWQK